MKHQIPDKDPKKRGNVKKNGSLPFYFGHILTRLVVQISRLIQLTSRLNVAKNKYNVYSFLHSSCRVLRKHLLTFKAFGCHRLASVQRSPGGSWTPQQSRRGVSYKYYCHLYFPKHFVQDPQVERIVTWEWFQPVAGNVSCFQISLYIYLAKLKNFPKS